MTPLSLIDPAGSRLSASTGIEGRAALAATTALAFTLEDLAEDSTIPGIAALVSPTGAATPPEELKSAPRSDVPVQTGPHAPRMEHASLPPAVPVGPAASASFAEKPLPGAPEDMASPRVTAEEAQTQASPLPHARQVERSLPYEIERTSPAKASAPPAALPEAEMSELAQPATSASTALSVAPQQSAALSSLPSHSRTRGTNPSVLETSPAASAPVPQQNAVPRHTTDLTSARETTSGAVGPAIRETAQPNMQALPSTPSHSTEQAGPPPASRPPTERDVTPFPLAPGSKTARTLPAAPSAEDAPSETRAPAKASDATSLPNEATERRDGPLQAGRRGISSDKPAIQAEARVTAAPRDVQTRVDRGNALPAGSTTPPEAAEGALTMPDHDAAPPKPAEKQAPSPVLPVAQPPVMTEAQARAAIVEPPDASPHARATTPDDVTAPDRAVELPKRDGATPAPAAAQNSALLSAIASVAAPAPPDDRLPSDGKDTPADLLGARADMAPLTTARAPLSLPPTAPAAQLAQSVGHQIGLALSKMPDQPVEISLSPEELGRVRLTLHASDQGMSVAIQAERPETLDLMRRNIDSLARDMRDLGFNSLSFSFDQRPGRQNFAQSAERGLDLPSEPAPHTAEGMAPAPPTRPTAPQSGLDLRF